MRFFESKKQKTCQPIILYPVKQSFKSEEEIKIFKDKNWGEFTAVRPALQEKIL